MQSTELAINIQQLQIRFGRYFLYFFTFAFPLFTVVTSHLFPPQTDHLHFLGYTLTNHFFDQIGILTLITASLISWQKPQYFQPLFFIATATLILTLAPTIIAAPERLFELNRGIIMIAIGTLFTRFWQSLILALLALTQPLIIQAHHLFIPTNYLMIYEVQVIILVGLITALKKLLFSAQHNLLTLHHKLFIQATYDDLTHLLNRKAFFQKSEELIALMQRHHTPFTLAMIDLDHFKQINDTYGHQVGDKMLQLVANTLKQTLKRQADLIGRYGGDELILLLPDTQVKTARSLLENIQQQLDHQPVLTPNKQKITASLSIGLAENHADLATSPQQTLDELIAQADQALYRAKDQGRHRISA